MPIKDLREGIRDCRMPGTGEPAEGLGDQELFAVYLRMGRNDGSAWGKELARRGITPNGLAVGPEGYKYYLALSRMGAAQKEPGAAPPETCPRCGCPSMRPALHTNALSRHAPIYICPACGTDEACRSMPGSPLGVMPFSRWAAVDGNAGDAGDAKEEA